MANSDEDYNNEQETEKKIENGLILYKAFIKSLNIDNVLVKTLDQYGGFFVWNAAQKRKPKMIFYYLQRELQLGLEEPNSTNYIVRSILRTPAKLIAGLPNLLSPSSCHIMRDCSKKRILRSCRYNSGRRQFTCQTTPPYGLRATGKNIIETPFEFAQGYKRNPQSIIKGHGKHVFIAAYDYLSIVQNCLLYLSKEYHELTPYENELKLQETAKALWELMKQIPMSNENGIGEEQEYNYLFTIRTFRDQLETFMLENPNIFYFCLFYKKYHSSRYFTHNVSVLRYELLSLTDIDTLRAFTWQHNTKHKNQPLKQILPMQLNSMYNINQSTKINISNQLTFLKTETDFKKIYNGLFFTEPNKTSLLSPNTLNFFTPKKLLQISAYFFNASNDTQEDLKQNIEILIKDEIKKEERNREMERLKEVELLSLGGKHSRRRKLRK